VGQLAGLNLLQAFDLKEAKSYLYRAHLSVLAIRKKLREFMLEGAPDTVASSEVRTGLRW
jgi:hypothetical protein